MGGGRVGFDERGDGATAAGGVAGGADVPSHAVGLLPHRDCVAVGVRGDLRATGVTIVGFDQRGDAPTAAGGVAVGPDVPAHAVVLLPHRDGVAVGVHGDSWAKSTASIGF